MRVKGIALIAIPKGIEHKFGATKLALWIAGLPKSSQIIFTNTIIPNQWYPLHEALTVPTRYACQLFFNSDPKGAKELGRFSAEYALRGLYRMFVRFGSPQFIIQKAGAIFHTYYDPCIIKVLEIKESSTILQIPTFPEMDEMLEYRIAGWMEAGLEICGCQSIHIDISQSLTRSDPCTEFTISWSKT